MMKKHDFSNNPEGDFGWSPFHNLQIMAVLMLQSVDYSFRPWNFASGVLYFLVMLKSPLQQKRVSYLHCFEPRSNDALIVEYKTDYYLRKGGLAALAPPSTVDNWRLPSALQPSKPRHAGGRDMPEKKEVTVFSPCYETATSQKGRSVSLQMM